MTLKSAYDLSEEKTRERFDERQVQQFRTGYGATAEGAAVISDLLGPLSDCIRNSAKKTNDLTVLLREVSPDQLAAAGLASLLHSIAIAKAIIDKDKDGDKKSIETQRKVHIGRSIQGELWAAGLLKNDRKRLNEIEKISSARHRHAAAKCAGWQQSGLDERAGTQGGQLVLRLLLSGVA